MRVGVYTCICEDDAYLIPQWIREVERLGYPFSIYFDHCSHATESHVICHPLCIAATRSHPDSDRDKFDECTKQAPFNKLVECGFDWALQWDVDETWEHLAPMIIPVVLEQNKDTHYIGVRYVTLWDSINTIRIDGPFSCGIHVKLYNLRGRRVWKFSNPIVNGAYLQGDRDAKGFDSALVCLNHGCIDHETRLRHKKRWDTIYGRHNGNPYGFWDMSLDYEKFPPRLAPNPYIENKPCA